MIVLTRRATFSASHYYWNDAWTAEKNEQVFGRCANRNGHGHNYTLEVTVAGEPDPVTGFVVDLKWLKDVMEREVLAAYDHRHLNLEVPEFAKTIPTTENIAIAAWKRLEPAIAAAGGSAAEPGAGLRDAGDFCRISRRSMKAYFGRRYTLSASHRLHTDALSAEENRATYGKCNNPHGHGHNYVVEVLVGGRGGPGNRHGGEHGGTG